MVKRTDEIMEDIQKYIECISKKIKIDRVILFGSYAHGNATIQSDIDLAIVSSEFGKSPLIEKMELYEWRLDSNITKDIQPVPVSRDDFLETSDFFISEIKKTGIDITNKLRIA